MLQIKPDALMHMVKQMRECRNSERGEVERRDKSSSLRYALTP